MNFSFFNKNKESQEDKEKKKQEQKIEKEKKQQREALAKERNFDEQVFEIGVKLRELKTRYKVIIERKLRMIRHNREINKVDKDAEEGLKTAYYSLIMVERAQEKLVQIADDRELCKAMNDMSSVFKMMNGLSKPSQKINDIILKMRIERMEGKSVNNSERIEEQEKMMKDSLKPVDKIVSDEIIEKLINGTSLQDCLDYQEGVKISPETVEEVAIKAFEDDDKLGGTSHEISDEEMIEAMNSWSDMMN